MRVCLDTNVLVAAFATRGLCADVLRTVLAEHELVIGDVILQELRDVLKRKFDLPKEQLLAVEATFAGLSHVPRPKRPSALLLPDESDRWVLATAVDGAADVLVTGDQAFLRAAADAPLPIVAPRAFWELLRSGRTPPTDTSAG